VHLNSQPVQRGSHVHVATMRRVRATDVLMSELERVIAFGMACGDESSSRAAVVAGRAAVAGRGGLKGSRLTFRSADRRAVGTRANHQCELLLQLVKKMISGRAVPDPVVGILSTGSTGQGRETNRPVWPVWAFTLRVTGARGAWRAPTHAAWSHGNTRGPAGISAGGGFCVAFVRRSR